MTITIEKAGLQTTVQGAPFEGYRHFGMPSAGAADCLSLALANRLVGKEPAAAALEITLDDVRLRVGQRCAIAVTGASGQLQVNGQDQPLHRTIPVNAGDEIAVLPALKGCRSYLSFSRNWNIPALWNTQSTYINAGLGGFEGRPLRAGDQVPFAEESANMVAAVETPSALRPRIADTLILRITKGPEFSLLTNASQRNFGGLPYRVSPRTSRMGSGLAGESLWLDTDHMMPSAPVFPGTIQLPGDGVPIILGPDAQTTGGYPRIGQVIRADRHLIGQMRPQTAVQFVLIDADQANGIYRQKRALLRDWIGDMKLW